MVAGGVFLLEAVRLVGRSRRGEPLKPMRLFHWSYTYLTILFIAVAVDAGLIVGRVTHVRDARFTGPVRSLDGWYVCPRVQYGQYRDEYQRPNA